MFLKRLQLFNIAALASTPVLRSFAVSATCSAQVYSTKMDAEPVNPTNPKEAASIYEFQAKDINGQVVSLEKYKGHVCIIVNVASQCGYAKTNDAELVDLYNEFGETNGLKILAFPCNQFGQEPGSNEEICSLVAKKSIKFDMFDKIDVNGKKAHPLWTFLKHKQGGTLGDFIKWNYTKFIIDKNGQPVERHGPSTNPKDLIKPLEKYF